MTTPFDPYSTWLGIPPEERPANHYRLLGLRDFEADTQVIEEAVNRRIAELRSHATERDPALVKKVLDEVLAARGCLLDRTKRKAYDRSLGHISESADEEAEAQAVDVDSTASFGARKPLIGIVIAGCVVVLGLVGWAMRHRSPVPTQAPPVDSASAAPEAETSTPTPPVDSPSSPASASSTPTSAVSPAPVPQAAPAVKPPAAVVPSSAKGVQELQRRWAEQLQLPIKMTNSIGMEFVLIPPGEFDMGTEESELAELLRDAQNRKPSPWYLEALPSESPRHRVRITRPFWLGRYEVTQREYLAVMKTSPTMYAPGKIHQDLVQGIDTSALPIDNVGWDTANEFCRQLSAMSAESGRRYRLPTEAEWEYACRAGTTTRYYWGSAQSQMNEYAWNPRNSGNVPHAVGQKRPNAWGLYDMLGNMWEWCADWHGPAYYRSSPSEAPTGPTEGTQRILRGGGFNGSPEFVRSAVRPSREPKGGGNYYGLRVVCEITTEATASPPVATTPAATSANPQTSSAAAKPALDSTGPVPVPSAAEQEKAREALSERFRDAVQKAKSASLKEDLAKMFLRKAQESGVDPVDRYLLLSAARDTAIQAGSTEIGLTAIDRLAESYQQVDPWPMRLDVMTAESKKPRTPPEQATFVARAMGMVDDILLHESVADGQIAVARDLLKLARTAAANARNKDLTERIRERIKDVEEAGKEMERVTQSREVLKSRPADPDANFVVGRYLCLMAGDWEKGLPMLAWGGNEDFKKAAQLELGDPATVEALTAVGNAWWDIAEQQPPSLRNAVKLHAASYYLEVRSRLKDSAATIINKRVGGIRSLLMTARQPQRIVNHTDQSVLVLIPAGQFRFGDPPFPVTLPAYYIGQTEVSNAQYAHYLAATGRPAPRSWDGGKYQAGRDKCPVSWVSWEEAQNYCRWAGLRLATELEWEKGARGTDGRLFPWGDKWDPRHKFSLQDVDSCPENRSPFGLYHMSGNVLEWVNGPADPQRMDRYRRGDFSQTLVTDSRLACGGAAGHENDSRRCTARHAARPDIHLGDVGFRVARDLIP
jgi:formylglycine-generating enzyme required for sulfatase activity